MTNRSTKNPFDAENKTSVSVIGCGFLGRSLIDDLIKTDLKINVLYRTKRPNFLGKNPIGFEMSKDKSLNIDDSFDLKIARSLVKKSNL